MPAADDVKSQDKSETSSKTSNEFIQEKYSNFQSFVKTLIEKNDKLISLIPVDSNYTVFITVFALEFPEAIKLAKSNDAMGRDISVAMTIDKLLLQYDVVLEQPDYNKLCRYMALWASVA